MSEFAKPVSGGAFVNDDMVPGLDDLWREAKDHVEHGYFDRAIEIYKYVLVRYGDNNLANEYTMPSIFS